MIDASFPPDLAQFVQTELASGRYKSEQELVLAAMRTFQEVETRRSALREHIQQGIDELDRGEGIAIESEDAMRAFFDDIQERGRQRYEASKKTS